jgi:hypothetical protein
MLNHIKKIFAWILVAVTALGTVGAFIVKWDDIMEVYYKYAGYDEHIIQYTKDLFSNPNKANLQVKILPNPNFKLGDKMKMSFTSEKEGQLLVFDINTKGELTLLMPNQFYDNKFKLKANIPFIIPENNWGFDLYAQEPIGKGMLLTILIENDIDLKPILPVHFQTLNGNMAKPILQHLHDRLKEKLGTQQWSGVFSDYEITK